MVASPRSIEREGARPRGGTTSGDHPPRPGGDRQRLDDLPVLRDHPTGLLQVAAALRGAGPGGPSRPSPDVMWHWSARCSQKLEHDPPVTRIPHTHLPNSISRSKPQITVVASGPTPCTDARQGGRHRSLDGLCLPPMTTCHAGLRPCQPELHCSISGTSSSSKTTEASAWARSWGRSAAAHRRDASSASTTKPNPAVRAPTSSLLLPSPT